MKTEALTGIDVLQRDDFASLHGQRVGLITNHTGLNREGQATADLLHTHPKVRLTALFGPEHGIRGALDDNVPDGQDARTGLPVYSLYGTRTRPTAGTTGTCGYPGFRYSGRGTRFYTYISTLGLCMEAAAEAGIPFVVLDRPNPLGGVQIEGPMADADKLSFTAHHPIPVRHGLTVGEMALLFHAEKSAQKSQAANAPSKESPLIIATVENWRRGDAWDRTGLTWTNPSPNMRSLTQAFLYPGIGLLEFTNVSVGRGTDTPFEVFGAPWIDGRQLAHILNEENLPGVRFVPIRFTPTASKHVGQVCGGINILVTHRDVFHPVLTGFALACALRDLYPHDWDISRYNILLANAAIYDAVKQGENYKELTRLCASDVQAFRHRCAPHLLYT